MKACLLLSVCCAAFAQECPPSPPPGPLVQAAATTFQQVETLQSVAQQLRAAGFEDLAQAATERAAQLKQKFLARLEADQQELLALRQHQPACDSRCSHSPLTKRKKVPVRRTRHLFVSQSRQ